MYVILRPHSNTNPTNAYRVMHSRDWVQLMDRAVGDFRYWHGLTYGEAVLIRDELNAELAEVSN